MDQPFKEPAWDPLAEEATRNLSPISAIERRHSPSTSTSTRSTNESNDSSGSRGRRSRPSVVSISSQLPTVREKNLQRTITEDKPHNGIIQDLKRRRYDQWKPKVTIKLVRAYLSGIDELTTIRLILQKKVELFRIMQLDVKKFETEDSRFRKTPDNAEGESSVQRLVWAMNTMKNQHACFERLLIDLKQSMDALFQLRSIEQNELAIISDSQNKAILVFTIVTVIFLPLSFFTSYYGMNLTGIVNTAKTEIYFWKVCGSVAFFIVVFTALGAFRHKLRTLLRHRMKAPSAMV